MLQALAATLPLALAKLIAVAPTTTAIVVMAGRKGISVAVAMVLGWLVAPICLGLALLIVAGATGRRIALTRPGAGFGVVEVIIGCAVLGLGVVAWLIRQRSPTGRAPRWLRTLDKLTWGRGALLGAALSLGLKGVILLLATVAVAYESGIAFWQQTVLVLLFATVGSLMIAAPSAVRFAVGPRSEAMLGAWRSQLERRGFMLTMIVLIGFGLVLIVMGTIDILS